MNGRKRITARPIVCGTDFSATAAAMARQLGAKLVLVQVDEFYGMAAVDPTLFEPALTHRRGELDRVAERLRELGTDVDEKLLSVSAFDELVNATIQSNAPLVVVGAVGHGLPRRLLLGSIAERTAEVSPAVLRFKHEGERAR
jgi:nucleotide-binding universal stress UspA family protein